MTHDEDPRRTMPFSIQWSNDNLIGSIFVAGERWAAVEWSEKRQQWCVEDAAGQCLTHPDCIHGRDGDKATAIAMAEAMIRDGRMPDPETAGKNLKARLKEKRERRAQQPAQIQKREEREALERRSREAGQAQSAAYWEEKKQPELYEVLADTLDFADPDLWKSNSFAALRPRLAVHMRYVIAKLESRLASLAERAVKQPFGTSGKAWRDERKHNCDAETTPLQAKLDRAREILKLLETP